MWKNLAIFVRRLTDQRDVPNLSSETAISDQLERWIERNVRPR
ncbi:MAG: hypothetical protein ACREM8_09720 [Vulcanimicrobiaceae bacterium]